jgi:hypothetical protein
MGGGADEVAKSAFHFRRLPTPRWDVIDQPEVLTLFGAQYGVATSAQLLDQGLSRRAITRAQERGALSWPTRAQPEVPTETTVSCLLRRHLSPPAPSMSEL